MLPIVKNCDILEQYCQFIEIVEQNYSRVFPRRSFKRAIELAMEQGILSDYLDRKSREVINMLCAKYDYKMDIAVKQDEARKDGIAIGIKQGIQQGAQKQAIETAINMLKNPKYSVDEISEVTGLPVEKVLELQAQLNEKA